MRWSAAASVGLLSWLCSAFNVAAALPQSGPSDADFSGVDLAALAYLAKQGTPGVSVVVASGDRIVYAQGYGYANRETQLPASPWLEYRLASSTKTLTATAVMRRVEQGKVLKTARELLRYRLLDLPLDRQLTEMLGPEPLSSGRFRFGTTLPSALTPAAPRYYDYPGAPLLPPVPGVYPNPAPATVASLTVRSCWKPTAGVDW